MSRELNIGTRFILAGTLFAGQFGCSPLVSTPDLHPTTTPTKTLTIEPPPPLSSRTPKRTLRSTSISTPTLKPTRTPRPTSAFTPTPNIFETQQAQWQDLENKEAGLPFELIQPEVTMIMRFPWQGGDGYWVELNDGLTAFKSDCVKEALEKAGNLGEQVDDGIWKPNKRIDLAKGHVKISKNVISSLLEPFDVKVPVVDLDEVVNEGKVYDCDVTTLTDSVNETGEKAGASLREIFEAARPQLKKVYPRLEQLWRIITNSIDLIDQSIEQKLTPTP